MSDLEFSSWLEKVMDLVEGHCGLSLLEAADYDWRCLYNDGHSPEEAVVAYEEVVHGL